MGRGDGEKEPWWEREKENHEKLRSSAILPLPPLKGGGGAKWQSFVLGNCSKSCPALVAIVPCLRSWS